MTMHMGAMGSMMVMVGLCGSMLASGGCTRDNPAFEDSDTPSSGADGSGGGTQGTTDGTATAVADDTSATDPTDPDAGVDSSSGGDVLCPLHPRAPIEITVLEPSGTVALPTNPCDRVIAEPNGSILIGENSLQHAACPDCNCNAVEGLTLDFGTTLELPDAAGLPTCGKLVVWEGLDPEGECRWDGFAILGDEADVIPTYLGANSRTFPLVFGPVPVGLEPEAVCEDLPTQCNHTPGRYALGFTSGEPVSVGMKQTVGIGFYAEVEYVVDNHMASIDPQCREHVAWSALRTK